MHDSDIIHLATHGAADGVYLSGTSKSDGKLTMAEVHGFSLNRCRLVVLSECDSFQGELRTDGVVGITRAFAAAGAMTTLASLWKVDDAATCVLMERFYESCREPSSHAASALQHAMCSMIRERKWSILQWSGFVAYGSMVSVPLHAT